MTVEGGLARYFLGRSISNIMSQTPASTDHPQVVSATEGHPVEKREAMVQKRLNRRGTRMLADINPLGWVALDASIAVFSAMLATALSPYVTIAEDHLSPLNFALAFGTVVTVVSHIAGLHDPRFPRAVFNALFRITAVVALSMSLLLVELNIIHFLKVGRIIVSISTATTIVLMFAVRVIAWQYARNFAQSICFVGGDAFCFGATRFVDEHEQSYRVHSLTDTAPEIQSGGLSGWAVERHIDEVIFDASDDKIFDDNLLGCLNEGIKVSSYSDFVEENYFLVPVEQIDTKWLFSARLDLAHPYYHGVKRLIDITASIAGLILSSPLLLFAVICIKLESDGPAFYSQVRSGRFNRPFTIYKLRTMVQNAEKDGAQWAKTGDSRITAIGKFLRKTRIDEIPQFWNVLKGEMSLVGPRPERPEFVKTLGEQIPFYGQRHLVKPGLTGWAQINYPYGASVEDALRKLTYDLYYVKRASIGLDLQILLRTVGAMMKGSR